MDREMWLLAVIGFLLILIGLLIHKGKFDQFISGYELLNWKGIDMKRFRNIIFIGFLFMGIGILIIPTTLMYFEYQYFASRSFAIIVVIGVLYIYAVGPRKTKKHKNRKRDS